MIFCELCKTDKLEIRIQNISCFEGKLFFSQVASRRLTFGTTTMTISPASRGGVVSKAAQSLPRPQMAHFSGPTIPSEATAW